MNKALHQIKKMCQLQSYKLDQETSGLLEVQNKFEESVKKLEHLMIFQKEYYKKSYHLNNSIFMEKKQQFLSQLNVAIQHQSIQVKNCEKALYDQLARWSFKNNEVKVLERISNEKFKKIEEVFDKKERVNFDDKILFGFYKDKNFE